MNRLKEMIQKVKIFLDKLKKGNPKVTITNSGKIEQRWIEIRSIEPSKIM